jgi:NAD(P)-dependent dehydrogenase (short-subunit alcohol dehydrogenase family)
MARIAPTAETTLESWDRVIGINLRGVWNCMKHVPIGRPGRPEEIASAVLWLSGSGASYVVGHALTVDGGMTVL